MHMKYLSDQWGNSWLTRDLNFEQIQFNYWTVIYIYKFFKKNRKVLKANYKMFVIPTQILNYYK